MIGREVVVSRQKRRSSAIFAPILLFWLLAIFSGTLWADVVDELQEAEIEQLLAGDMIIKSLDTGERPGSEFEVFKLMPVALSELFGTLTCYQDYPNFMPNVARLEVVRETASIVDANYHLALPMNQSKRYRVRLQTKQQAGRAELHWKQIPWPEVALEDSIADTVGYWLLQAESPSRTWVKYHVYTDPGPIPFGFGWIVDILTRVSLPDVLNSTESYAIAKKSSCLAASST